MSEIKPNILTIETNTEPIVTIKPDGEVIVNPKYTMTQAAELFWEKVVGVNPYKRANNWRKIEGDADLPEEDGKYLVTAESVWMKTRSVTILLFSVEHGEFGLGEDWLDFNIVAWMPMPEPFQGE